MGYGPGAEKTLLSRFARNRAVLAGVGKLTNLWEGGALLVETDQIRLSHAFMSSARTNLLKSGTYAVIPAAVVPI